jgi:hypothetical protein
MLSKGKLNNSKKKKKHIFLFIIAVLIVMPILTAQINYGKNALSAESFSSFSSGGYIQNQNSTSVFKYGFNTSNKSGCGWIATYNVLTYLHNEGLYQDEIKIEDVIKPLDTFATFALGFLGTNPLVIKWLLESKGLKVDLVTNKDNFEEKAKASNINIMVYVGKYLNYGHYQMMEYNEMQDNFIFYTPASTKTMAEYLTSHENDHIFLLAISI